MKCWVHQLKITDVVLQWLVHQTSKQAFIKETGRLSVLYIVILFPWSRNLTQHCLSQTWCINGYHQIDNLTKSWGNPVIDLSNETSLTFQFVG